MKVSLILACAGKGARAGFNKNKLLEKINNQTIIEKTLSAFYQTGLIDEYIVATSKEDYDLLFPILPKEAIIVIGGETRTESVKNALGKTTGDIVLIHDGARPFVSKKVISDCIETAKTNGSAIPVVPIRDTICRASEDKIEQYVGKQGLFAVQTPQGFTTEKIKKAYESVLDKTFNDDGEVYSSVYGSVSTYLSDDKNIKLTYKEDFEKLNTLPLCKVGTGFDCHKLVENRKLILGGIEIPHDKGLLGHSDADVLTHAIMDGMLSALSLRDIGYHFPDTDEKYKGANSIELLKEVIALTREKGYKLKSLSAVIMAEKPKLLKHIPSIANNLANVLAVEASAIGIGATTLEGLGFVGREEGICVYSSCVMVKIDG